MKRVTVSLEDDVYSYLEQRAILETRTVPNILAYLAAEAYKKSPIVASPKTGVVQALLQQNLAQTNREWSKATSERERVEQFAQTCKLEPLEVFSVLAGDKPDHRQIVALAIVLKRNGESMDSTELAALVHQQYGKRKKK